MDNLTIFCATFYPLLFMLISFLESNWNDRTKSQLKKCFIKGKTT